MSSAHLRELADLLIRWVHLIAGIMWIGNSLLFNWLDRNLEKAEGCARGRFEGRIWMVHSGGFYDVVKKQLEPGQLPERPALVQVAELHHLGERASSSSSSSTTWAAPRYMIDPAVRALEPVGRGGDRRGRDHRRVGRLRRALSRC